MKGFDPGTSFGYEVVRSYDADSIRGDEDETRLSRSGWPAEGNIHHRRAGR